MIFNTVFSDDVSDEQIQGRINREKLKHTRKRRTKKIIRRKNTEPVKAWLAAGTLRKP